MVPAAVLSAAISRPDSVAGWGIACNPNLQESPWNVRRAWLSLQYTGKPYHPLYNGLAWRCGCS